MKFKNPSDIFIEVYKNVASLVAEYELRIRLLANCTNELKKYKSEKLYELETKFIKHFSFLINENEKENLKKYRKLRNKFLHVEFKQMLVIISELNPKQKYNPNVRQFNFSSDEPMLDQITKRINDAPFISNLNSYDSFAWLIECCTSGVMSDVEKSMQEAIEIINKCRDYNFKKD